jgi:NAD(P)-dependent dehydrogenase (short-subunit alcohol dehydrogenase family)
VAARIAYSLSQRNGPADAASAPVSEQRFSARHALITGAGSGIGQAAALALAREGALVTLVGRRSSRLEETADRIRASCETGVTVASADVRDVAQLEAAFDAGQRQAPIDLLVTSAGVNHPSPLAATPIAQIGAMLDINILGTLLACRTFALQTAARGPRAIVCVSSQMGVVGYPGRAPYCATKHAVNGLTKALALEWAPDQIRVNAVAPTFLKTPFTARMFVDDRFRREVINRIPLARLGTLEEVSSAILYLLSNEASMITGQILGVDGGWTAI